MFRRSGANERKDKLVMSRRHAGAGLRTQGIRKAYFDNKLGPRKLRNILCKASSYFLKIGDQTGLPRMCMQNQLRGVVLRSGATKNHYFCLKPVYLEQKRDPSLSLTSSRCPSGGPHKINLHTGPGLLLLGKVAALIVFIS